MDPRTNGYFTNLIQSGSNEEQCMMESQCFHPNAQVATQETQFTAAMESISRKAQRGGNFTVEEDKLLVSAWLNISMDAVQGNDQKKTTFWQRVKEFIQENEPYETNRTLVSLMNRWSTIQLCTNKFCSCYGKIEALNQSGINEEQKLQNAKKMYKELNEQQQEFKFDHCWVLLKNQPKWFLECEKKKEVKKPRKGLPPCPSTPDTINLGDDNVAADNFVDLERPTGQKAAKARVVKRKNGENVGSTEISGVLDKIKECKSKLTDKKLEMLGKTYDQEQEKIRIKKELLDMKQFEADERVMMMDLNCLSEEQQEFYRLRRLEILGKRRRVQ
ncbi:hypothetical protein RHGRI_012279 [Rhododendron griersonianum]|uniref:No apical meristem-associated C-terminal domain-containing protein n=1 Tax=Rhododendron griersonianum TaxID=479676 RepID=A0AAV6KR41_9ERIC|nr:hypothetical protein RHGRI_012279 [Rhododendron griersonianum]